jgi:hypothetical protein
MLVPAIVGFLVMGLPASTFWEWQAGDPRFELASSHLSKNLLGQRNKLEPRLVSHESRGMSGEPVPLGLTLRGRDDGGVVVIAGLVPGMTLSNGSAVGPTLWKVSATDLANTWVGPPQNFVGAVKLEAELHLPDRATVAHRESIHVEWIAAGSASPEQVPIASPSADSEQIPIATGPAGPDQVPTASAPADSEQVPITTGPAGPDQVPTAPAPADSEHVSIATGPSDPDQVPIASALADSERVPIATGSAGPDQLAVGSAAADSEKATIATGPSDSSQMPAASTPVDTEQVPIVSGRAGPEQISVAVAPLQLFPAPQLLDHEEIATEVRENSLAKSERYAASGHEKPPTNSQARAREFIDTSGVAQIILPRWQSEPMADTRAVKQVVGGTLPASTGLMSQNDIRVAALPGNKAIQQASDPRSQHKSGASNSTSSRQIAKNRSKHEQITVTPPPITGATPSRLKPSGSPPSNASRPGVIYFPASGGPPVGFRPGFHRRGPPFPVVFFRPPMLPMYFPVGRL